MPAKGALGFDPLAAYWDGYVNSWEDLVPGYDDDSSRMARSEQASQQMLGTLLPHQEAFVTDKTTRHLGLVAGFGAGKSHSLCVKALQLCYDNPGFTGILMEPSFGMLRDIIVPLVDQLWSQWGVSYTYRRSPEPEFNVVCPNGEVSTVLLRSFENVARIRGINAAWALVDEIDTVKPDLAEQAFNLLIGRIRTGPMPQIAVASTPEGFGFCYDFFCERDDDTKRLIRAKTTDNPYLPESYIDGLRSQYPPNLLAAYLNGEFVNLARTVVFSEYDRMRHQTQVIKPEPDEAVYIGADFNVGQCHQVHGVIRQERGHQVMHVFKQTATKTTYELADLLQRMYPTQAVQRKIYVAPDAAGGASHSSSTQTDHQILQAKGYRLINGRSNPGVFDSIAHVNSLFHQDRLKINHSSCGSLANACERWALDDKGQPLKGGSNDYSHEGDALRYLTFFGMNGAHRTLTAGPRTY
jgi:hypothetical protein